MINRLCLIALMVSAPMVPAAAQNAQGTGAPAARTPQPLPRANYLQRVDATFVRIDANKDGFTDRAELEAAESRALAQLKARALREREAGFRRLDKDKNGSLTLAEFNAIAAAQPLPKPDATRFLAQIDTNKDGKVSLAENRAPAMVQFDRLDTNKDGSLSVAEQRAAAAAAANRR